jgi:acetolactate synthase-1/2/3 large subunit
MKVSDFIVEFLESKLVTDIFGYPGVGCGHFMDSLSKSKIESHLVYHEQAAAFAACSYAQATRKIGIAYTTAGPGGTNLITGVANAYCDSIPTLFLVGDKDLSSLRGKYNLRQKASQEIDITDIARPTTKWSYQVTKKEEIKYVLEKAFSIALTGRPGPVLLDIPSDIQRADVIPEELICYKDETNINYNSYVEQINEAISVSEKPVILVGNGVKQAGLEGAVLEYAKSINIPIVTTLVCFDLYINESIKIGYIGLDGDAAANRIINDCDLLITLGARLNFKQVCNNRITFAPNAKIIRIDCDDGELEYRLRDECAVCADLNYLIPNMINNKPVAKKDTWLLNCIDYAKNSNRGQVLNTLASNVVSVISDNIPNDIAIAVDTGSHRRWVMSSFKFKSGQRLYQSAGLVSMGYSVPASIGLYFATKKPVICFDGDGGIMMNLQELEFIDRDRLPITIILMNNSCLGDIMEFQKKIFKGNYYTTTESTGYKAADFELIAKAFHLYYKKIEKKSDLDLIDLCPDYPQLIEVVVPSNVK